MVVAIRNGYRDLLKDLQVAREEIVHGELTYVSRRLATLQSRVNRKIRSYTNGELVLALVESWNQTLKQWTDRKTTPSQ